MKNVDGGQIVLNEKRSVGSGITNLKLVGRV